MTGTCAHMGLEVWQLMAAVPHIAVAAMESLGNSKHKEPWFANC